MTGPATRPRAGRLHLLLLLRKADRLRRDQPLALATKKLIPFFNINFMVWLPALDIYVNKWDQFFNTEFLPRSATEHGRGRSRLHLLQCKADRLHLLATFRRQPLALATKKLIPFFNINFMVWLPALDIYVNKWDQFSTCSSKTI